MLERKKKVSEKLDLYDILELSSRATRDQIVNSYKILALRWHPARNENDRERAQQNFKNLAIAYEVLMDTDRRAVYDKTGKYEGRLKEPIEIFTDVLGPNYDIDVVNEDFTEYLVNTRPLEQDPPVYTDFQCTLEQLYMGVTKVFDVTKNIEHENGTLEQEKKRIHIKVKPGWRSGTKIIFPREGDIHPGKIPADLIFVLQELPHAYYTREGDNLIYNAKITLKQALKGVRLHLPFLDGSTKTEVVQKVISPDIVHMVKNYGMPRKDSDGYGDLYVKFQILFPLKLNETQREHITKAFDDSIEWV